MLNGGWLDINGVRVPILPPAKGDECTQIRLRVRYDDLIIHPKAQRDLRRPHVEHLKRTFNLNVPTLTAVRYPRDGGLPTLIVDGQHCTVAARELGYGQEYASVTLHTDVVNDKQAHDRFLMLNDRKGVSAIDTYRNELGAEHADVVEVEAVLLNHGLKVQEAGGAGVLRCPRILMAIHKRLGSEQMDEMFSIIWNAWGFTTESLEGMLLDGLSQVLRCCGDKMDSKRMASQLKRFRNGPIGLVGAAKSQRLVNCRMPQTIAMLMITEYNVGIRKEERRLVYKVMNRQREAMRQKLDELEMGDATEQ